ncbi:2900_t:CDS:2 [Paraglomus occultum]|uniref:2900_t:CDS:1 n=1 Tax=Paraglomus occultum TaxID=144539 RepID=A0A9N9G8I0_9GLOM|nr:2900_t:CDS:2 [Paraglomus occultum]
MVGIIGNVAGWAGFGFAVRVLAMALEKRPLLDKPITHLATAAVFGGVGWYIYEAEHRQAELIQKRKRILLENRKRRAELEASRNATSE